MKAVTDPHPFVTNCHPDIPDVAPVTIVIAVKSPVSVQSLQTAQPVAMPVEAA